MYEQLAFESGENLVIQQLKDIILRKQTASLISPFAQHNSLLNQSIKIFLKSQKKVLLLLIDENESVQDYLKQFIYSYLKQEGASIGIPLFIKLEKLKNPFEQLLQKGLRNYGLTTVQVNILLKSKPNFLLILTNFEKLNQQLLNKNLYLTNKLQQHSIKKIIIACSASYIAHQSSNYQLFFMSYQKNYPQKELFQELNLAGTSLTLTNKAINVTHTQFIDDQYWHDILINDWEELAGSFKVRGFQSLPAVEKMQQAKLNQVLIVDNTIELRAHADIIAYPNANDGKSKEFEFKQFLFLLLRYSKRNSQLAIGAANAITILNYARIAFSGMNLSHIHIPNADLSYSICHRTALREANLKKLD